LRSIAHAPAAIAVAALLLTPTRLLAGHWPDDATGVLACRRAVIRLTLRRSLPSARHYVARAQSVAHRAAIHAQHCSINVNRSIRPA
jgi:hypothetical protein